MLGYENLRAFINPGGRCSCEILFDFDTEQATVYGWTKEDIRRGIKELEKRGLLKGGKADGA